MKTQNLYPKKIVKQIALSAFCFVIALTVSVSAFGQSKNDSCRSELKKAYKLNSFAVKCIEGKAYVKWEVIEPNNESLYLIEKSDDVKNFSPVFAKRSMESPGVNQLLHCFVDEYPLAETSYYRLRRISKDGSISSEIFIIVNDRISFSD